MIAGKKTQFGVFLVGCLGISAVELLMKHHPTATPLLPPFLPLKRKEWLYGNQNLHINKTLIHETMKRSKLENKANKTKNASDKKNYKKLISMLCS